MPESLMMRIDTDRLVQTSEHVSEKLAAASDQDMVQYIGFKQFLDGWIEAT